MQVLDAFIRLMTTSSVVVGATAVYAALRNHTRQLNAQIFLAYSDRLQTIRRVMRTDLLPSQVNDLTLEERSRLLPATMEVLHLVLELRELNAQGYVKPKIWAMWTPDIDRLLDAPFVRGAASEIHREFVTHGQFVAWLEERQRTIEAERRA
jgi:hypothetical protein